MELFSDDRFGPVRPDPRWCAAKQRGILLVGGRRNACIAEADVDLECQPCIAESRNELDTKTVVLSTFSDGPCPHGFGDERQAVVGARDDTKRPKHGRNRIGIVGHIAGKIHVPGRPIEIAPPHGQQHCPLEHKLLPIWRGAESIQKALSQIALKRKVEVFALRECTGPEARVDRGRNVPSNLLHETSDSR
jgi:hypothetical protein